MKNEFIPYEIALALKELGFNESCLGFYYKLNDDFLLEIPVISYKENKNSIIDETFDNKSECITAPLYQQAFRWFREKYKMFPYTYTGNGNLFHYCMFIKERDNQYHSNKLYLSNEEAELECLKKLIEIVKKLKQKIIIPKEEPKGVIDIPKITEECGFPKEIWKPKQETLEEVAEIWVHNRFTKQIKDEDIYASKSSIIESHILFAKWQQEKDKEMEKQQQGYSEEEVLNIIADCDGSVKQAKKWFEQFKNK